METQQHHQNNIQKNNGSSPSHEFSFTISLNSSNISNDKSKPPPPDSLALDLSPADDIFFHGHLLPLHLLSHSPRFSTNSNDSFTLPILEQQHHHTTSFREQQHITTKEYQQNKSNGSSNSTSKHSFSLFGSTKTNQKGENNNREKQNNKKKLVGHEMIHALKKYLKITEKLFRGNKREKNNNRFQREAYSRSGNLIRRNKPEIRGSRGEYSAPASMRTSPTNSGLLIARGGSSSSCGKNDSTMEELHAAIQAAIAHCKNSIAQNEDKFNSIAPT